MIRVKIRFQDGPKKLLRFDESIDFNGLLHAIATKLGVKARKDSNISTFFQLTLEGDTIVEESREIENGDSLVLKRMVDETDIYKEESKGNKNIDGDDNDTIEDVIEDINERAKQEREKLAEDNTIYISSDDEERSVEEGSDVWENCSEDSDYPEDSSFEEIKTKKKAIITPNRKRKRADKKATPESPLQVLMDEKDVPAAPRRISEPAENDDASAGPWRVYEEFNNLLFNILCNTKQ
mmetsp:Transcript_1116/g.1714  ORF Transcript_1116/g.1714 Transcript_1116/m.1714 type:complete len:238 (-) Transcript_1116:13-726(-)